MRKLSAVIITYNEEANIERALRSVGFADEIVVVDSFSTDGTVEICGKYTGKIVQREFKGHIDQKNYAMSLAENDWVLSIDADEEVTNELGREIAEILKSGDDKLKAGYRFPRRAFYLGRWIRHGSWYPDYKVRLVNKNRAKWGGTDPHDRMILDGECGTLKGEILHYPYRDAMHHLQTINSYTSIAAKRLLANGKRAGIADLTVRPFFSFTKEFIIKLGFLDGSAGFIIAVSSAFYTFSKYLKLYELNKKS